MSPFGRLGKGNEFHGVRGKKITIDQDLLVREFSLNLQTFIDQGSRLAAARLAAGLIPVIKSLPKKPVSGNQNKII